MHSPQPENPSARTSTNSTRRSLVSPKLVAKGWIRDMLSSRRTIESIFMNTCPIPVVVVVRSLPAPESSGPYPTA